MDKELTIQDLEAQADALLAAADEKNDEQQRQQNSVFTCHVVFLSNA